jgi:hypothetical protein
MRDKLFCSSGLWILAATLAIGLTSCSKDEAPQPAAAEKAESAPKAPETPKTAEAPPSVPADDEAKVLSLLAKADALDGQVDKVVTKCASCLLSMDGKPEHSLKAMGYTMHFCTEDCAQKFGKDLTQSILAMKIPESDSPGMP